MAVLLSDAEYGEADVLPHKTWTREELAVLESTGVFEGTHYELIDGELIDKMGKKRPHVRATDNLRTVLTALFGRRMVEQEVPIDVASDDLRKNEPEPDVIVLRAPHDDMASNPQPVEIVLLVEVADTTLRQDLRTKSTLYARAGIPEYWVLDLNGRGLHVLRDPAEGAYRTRLEFHESDSVAPLAKPESPISVAALLP
ncbi:MAG: Uma2 family endonuclease [Bryobacteraceae bacterium]